jgi:hypothetical protein
MNTKNRIRESILDYILIYKLSNSFFMHKFKFAHLPNTFRAALTDSQ